MELRFRVQMKIQKPVAEVFDAVYNPAQLSGYFTTGGASAPLVEGTTVTWRFADYPGDIPVQVRRVIPNQKIVFEWEASENCGDAQGAGEAITPVGYNTTVEMEFKALSPQETLVSIAEHGWRPTPQGLAGSYGNCQGWTQMQCCLKAYLEYGINLRQGAY